MFIRITSYLSFILIVAASLCYSVFGPFFAELHVQVPCFDFPIFIGEWLMMFCVGILLVQLALKPVCWRSWRGWVLGYFLWVMVKAAEGYINGGGYALRNAALFYYPVFAILAAHFFRQIRFSQAVVAIFCVFMFLLLGFMTIISNVRYAFLVAGLLVSASLSSLLGRRIFFGLFLLVFSIRFVMTSSGRGCLVGATAGFLFLAWYSFQLLRVSPWKQLLGISAVGVLLWVSVWLWGDRNAFVSLISPAKISEAYCKARERMEAHRGEYVFRYIKAQIYHADPKDDSLEVRVAPVVSRLLAGVERRPLPVVPPAVAPPAVTAEIPRSQTAPVDVKQSSPRGVALPVNAGKDIVARPLPEARRESRDLGTAYVNEVFRFLVWRDMLKELVQSRPVFGFSFGRPQRSVSLEILHWAETEWDRDGWIAPHNSFLHMIYRGGIVGLALIAVIVFLIIRMTRDFLRYRSGRGGLLVSALVCGVVIAQFGVILELPYNAIPFWTLFGVALAYRDQCSVKEGRC